MDETSVGLVLHVVQRREDEMGNPHFLRNVSHVFALGVLNIGIHGFPVVRRQEDSMGALQGCGEGVNGAKIGLKIDRLC